MMVVTSTINITIMITIINFLSACVAVSTCACANIKNAVHASISTYTYVHVSISEYSICLYAFIYIITYTSMYHVNRRFSPICSLLVLNSFALNHDDRRLTASA